MLLRTPFAERHKILNAKLIPFSGWEMPIQYKGIIDEANVVRKLAGFFDVSHMGRIEIFGDDAGLYLEKVLTVSATKMAIASAKYCFILNENAGIIDDVVIYRNSYSKYLLICNASNRETVIHWLNEILAEFKNVSLSDLTFKTVMIALQGPSARKILSDYLKKVNYYDSLESVLNLNPFQFYEYCLRSENSEYNPRLIISRTGYTGEDGFEIIASKEIGLCFWDDLLQSGASPCGLGSRDVLRLEAGLRLHGNDMDQNVNPIQAGLSRFVDWDNFHFSGYQELLRLNEIGIDKRLVGFNMLTKAIPRRGYLILDSQKNIIGEVTSGSHSPALNMDIGMGYIADSHSTIGDDIVLRGRGRDFDACVVKMPFYRRSSN
jgi:aminomethyltransferase